MSIVTMLNLIYLFLFFFSSQTRHLEDHLVWLVIVLQRELSLEVSLKHWHSSNSLHQSSVNFLLVSLASVGNNSWLDITSEDISLQAFLSASKVFVIEGWYIHRGNINLGGGSNNVCWAYTTEWNTVYLVWSRNEYKAWLKNLEANYTLSSETSSQKDEYSSWSNRSAYLGWVLCNLWCSGWYIISRVVLSCWCNSWCLGKFLYSTKKIMIKEERRRKRC